MAVISPPPAQSAFDKEQADKTLRPDAGWVEFQSSVYKLLSALVQSGTTAQRPVTFLYVGRFYMDVTLNKPVWYTLAGWRDATGALV
jgi:hypothetical protein